jgi:hypothetical protein
MTSSIDVLDCAPRHFRANFEHRTHVPRSDANYATSTVPSPRADYDAWTLGAGLAGGF